MAIFRIGDQTGGGMDGMEEFGINLIYYSCLGTTHILAHGIATTMLDVAMDSL